MVHRGGAQSEGESTMKAVVLTEAGEIALAERPVPEVHATGLLLKVSACGICGTDLHAPAAKAMFADNVVLGHEFAGTVVEAGKDVQGFVPGDGVVVNPIALSCGVCNPCRRGFTNQCRVALESTSGVAKDGGLAEYVVIDGRQAHRVPDAVGLQDAAWTEPLGVAVPRCRSVSFNPARASPSLARVRSVSSPFRSLSRPEPGSHSSSNRPSIGAMWRGPAVRTSSWDLKRPATWTGFTTLSLIARVHRPHLPPHSHSSGTAAASSSSVRTPLHLLRAGRGRGQGTVDHV